MGCHRFAAIFKFRRADLVPCRRGAGIRASGRRMRRQMAAMGMPMSADAGMPGWRAV